MISIAPTLAGMASYPFVRLEEARRRLVAQGVDVIDFGKGDPNEPTDPIIRQALVDALPERSPLPARRRACRSSAMPSPAGARAASASTLDPDTEIVPTLRLEGGDLLARAGARRSARGQAPRRRTASRRIPVYERGALFAGAEVHTLPLLRENGFLPDLDAVADDTWRGPRSCGSTTRTTRRARSRRSRSTSGSPSSRASTTSRSPPTRRTPSSGSTSRRSLRCRSPTGRA